MAANKSFGVFIEGAAELQAAFRELPFALQAQALRPGLRAGGKVLKRGIELRAPADEGELAKSFKVKSIKRSRTKIGVQVISEVGHAAQQELGWQAGPTHVPGKRFIRGAMEEEREQIFKAVTSTAKQKLPDVIRKAKAKGKL